VQIEQEEARKAMEEKERNASFAMEEICLTKIGFMPLKKARDMRTHRFTCAMRTHAVPNPCRVWQLLMERGVPKEEVFACANKFALSDVSHLA